MTGNWEVAMATDDYEWGFSQIEGMIQRYGGDRNMAFDKLFPIMHDLVHSVTPVLLLHSISYC